MEAICADCHTLNLVRLVSACTDYHLYRSSCCTKYVCWDFCRQTCRDCKIVNRVSPYAGVDNYYDGFSCYACQQLNALKIEYTGNARIECTRFCTSNCYAEPVYISGRPELDAQEIILRRELTPAIGVWLLAYFGGEDQSEMRAIITRLSAAVQAESIQVQALEALYDAYQLYLARTVK